MQGRDGGKEDLGKSLWVWTEVQLVLAQSGSSNLCREDNTVVKGREGGAAKGASTAQHPSSCPGSPERPSSCCLSGAVLGLACPAQLSGAGKVETSSSPSSAPWWKVMVAPVMERMETWLSGAGAWLPRIRKQLPDAGISSFVQTLYTLTKGPPELVLL